MVIVVLMSIFLGIQGYLGIRNINQMQQVSEDIFSQSLQGVVEFQKIQNEFNEFQNKYLADLIQDEKQAPIYFNTLQNLMEGKLFTLKKVYPFPELFRDIEVGMARIGEIVRQPVNSIENYRQVEREIMAIKSITLEMNGKVMNSTIKSMSLGNNLSNTSRRNTLLILFSGALLSTLIGLLIASFIASPLKMVGSTANALAAGDLSKDITAIGSIQVGRVVESLNIAIRSLRNLVIDINEQSQILYNASQELKFASFESGRSAADVAKVMEELAKAATEEGNQLNQAVKTVSYLAGLVHQVSTEVKSITMNSEEVATSAKAGKTVTGDIAQEIVKIYDSTKKVMGVINELNHTSEEIGETTSIIQGIAEQTTLLALNASIEAARAGESGKGFAVVATETGKLAEQSKQAAQLITDSVEKIKTRTKLAVQTINSSMETVESGKKLTAEATITFEKIFERLNSMLSRIESVALSARQMADNSEDVMTSVNSIAALRQESMAITEEVSATAEEQSASAEEVTALADNLESVAAQLKKSVSTFKVS